MIECSEFRMIGRKWEESRKVWVVVIGEVYMVL